jgi:hypothetical protein
VLESSEAASAGGGTVASISAGVVLASGGEGGAEASVGFFFQNLNIVAAIQRQ